MSDRLTPAQFIMLLEYRLGTDPPDVVLRLIRTHFDVVKENPSEIDELLRTIPFGYLPPYVVIEVMTLASKHRRNLQCYSDAVKHCIYCLKLRCPKRYAQWTKSFL